MSGRRRRFILIFSVLLAVPTTALAASWLLWHSRPWNARMRPQQGASELGALYQLREFCNQSDLMEKRIDFAVRISEGDEDGKIGIRLGLPASSVPNGMDFDDSQRSRIVEWRSRQVRILRDRNSRYLETVLGDAKKYGTDSLVWGRVLDQQAELTTIVKAGEFQDCMAELDGLLPTKVVRGGRQ
jgi:hypothetical protein